MGSEIKICPVCGKKGKKEDMIRNGVEGAEDEWCDYLHPECFEKCEEYEREQGLR